jgi:uncharacterized glyoxalase superfamily protein PhnB
MPVLLALQVQSKERVNKLMEKALEAGGGGRMHRKIMVSGSGARLRGPRRSYLGNLLDGSKGGAAVKGSQVDRVFALLAKGVQLLMPLSKIFSPPRHSMLSDRLGVGWMV